ADHQPVADDLVLAHALHGREVLEARGLRPRGEQCERRAQRAGHRPASACVQNGYAHPIILVNQPGRCLSSTTPIPSSVMRASASAVDGTTLSIPMSWRRTSPSIVRY